ncbi:hypothetical protein ACVWZK_004869 [Bradyrhizobium sp. GM0.4]
MHEHAGITGVIPFMYGRATAKFLPQFKLGTKALLCAVLLIAMNTALVVGAGYWSLSSAFNDRALRDIEVSLRTLALALCRNRSRCEDHDAGWRGGARRDSQDAGL